MKSRSTAVLAGAVAGLALLALTTQPLFAQQTPTPAPGQAPTHEQMDQAMDAAHGEGTSQRMHEAMGQGDAQKGEQLMQQCVDMMGMMQNMQGMMGSGGMMVGPNGQSIPSMMSPGKGR